MTVQQIKTRAILDRMAAQIPHLRVIHLAQNQGKAIALKTGAAAAKSEYLVCIDGDAFIRPRCGRHILWKTDVVQPACGCRNR